MNFQRFPRSAAPAHRAPSSAPARFEAPPRSKPLQAIYRQPELYIARQFPGTMDSMRDPREAYRPQASFVTRSGLDVPTADVLMGRATLAALTGAGGRML